MKKKIAVLFATVFMSVFISAFMLVNTAYADYYSEHITLRQGIRNSEVYNLQDDLKELGYLYCNSTGYFGSLTYQAVINYQRDKNISADGIVGSITARHIKADMVILKAKSYQGVPYYGAVHPRQDLTAQDLRIMSCL